MTHEKEIATIVEVLRLIATRAIDGQKIDKLLDGISRDDGEKGEKCVNNCSHMDVYVGGTTLADGAFRHVMVCRTCGQIGRDNGREIEWWPTLPAELPPENRGATS